MPYQGPCQDIIIRLLFGPYNSCLTPLPQREYLLLHPVFEFFFVTPERAIF